MITRDKAIDSVKSALQETENRLIKKPTYVFMFMQKSSFR